MARVRRACRTWIRELCGADREPHGGTRVEPVAGITRVAGTVRVSQIERERAPGDERDELLVMPTGASPAASPAAIEELDAAVPLDPERALQRPLWMLRRLLEAPHLSGKRSLLDENDLDELVVDGEPASALLLLR